MIAFLLTLGTHIVCSNFQFKIESPFYFYYGQESPPFITLVMSLYSIHHAYMSCRHDADRCLDMKIALLEQTPASLK